jgi:hypothetical protein
LKIQPHNLRIDLISEKVPLILHRATVSVVEYINTMVVYNAFTGLKRKQPRYLTSRKKRKSMSSTVVQRMYAKNAMDAFWMYMYAHKKALCYLVLLMGLGVDFNAPEWMCLRDFLVLAAASFAGKAALMV